MAVLLEFNLVLEIVKARLYILIYYFEIVDILVSLPYLFVEVVVFIEKLIKVLR